MTNGRDHKLPGPGDTKNEASGTSMRSLTIKDDRIDSRALFGTARQITIEHGADTYILRLTAQNKLILTK